MKFLVKNKIKWSGGSLIVFYGIDFFSSLVFSDDDFSRVRAYDRSGNMRKLENILEQALSLWHGDVPCLKNKFLIPCRNNL